MRDKLRAVARSIVSGETSEREGAAQIWALLAEADYPDELHEARVAFVGPISEWQDHPEDAETYAAYIRESAERFSR